MSEYLDKTINEIQKRIAEWTDERGYNFIKELILSGDIHIWKTNPTAFISERDYDERPKTVTFKDANLWSYEPYRGMREKESQLAEAISVIKFYAQDGGWDCGCGCCMEPDTKVIDDMGDKAKEFMEKHKLGDE